MKFSKLLKMLLGMAGLFNMGIVEEGGGGSAEPLNAQSAADAFSSLLGDDDPAESESQDDDTPEAAAERLAKQELSGNEDDPEVTDPAPDAGAVTIEIDGKAVTLTKEQIAENHKNGLRQADYTRKTMEAAEARKTAEAETSKARQERDSYGQKLHTFAISQQAAIQEQEALLTDDLLTKEPLEYLAIERTVKQRQANLAQAQQELQQIGQQQQQEHAESQRAYIETQREQLLAKLPEWSDPKKAAADQTAIWEYLSTQGFDANDLRAIGDHRQVLLARKAMQYDALIERAGKAVKKVAALPVKAERAGSAETSRTDGRTEALKRLGKSGSIADAADAFSKFL